jgi:hypothetical protein
LAENPSVDRNQAWFGARGCETASGNSDRREQHQPWRQTREEIRRRHEKQHRADNTT